MTAAVVGTWGPRGTRHREAGDLAQSRKEKEIYLELIRNVDRDGLGVHLDPANLVTHPRVYYDTTGMIDRCLDLLGEHILSCHAKDVHWTLDCRTIAIEEVVPGRGILDYATHHSLRRLGENHRTQLTAFYTFRFVH